MESKEQSWVVHFAQDLVLKLVAKEEVEKIKNCSNSKNLKKNRNDASISILRLAYWSVSRVDHCDPIRIHTCLIRREQ